MKQEADFDDKTSFQILVTTAVLLSGIFLVITSLLSEMYGSNHGHRDPQLYNPHGFIEIVNEIERYEDYPCHSEQRYAREEREHHYQFCGEEDSYTAGHEQYFPGCEQYSMSRSGAVYENLRMHSLELQPGEI